MTHSFSSFIAPLAATAALLAAAPAQADYIWLAPESGQARVQSGEVGKVRASLPTLTDARAVQAEGGSTPLDAGAQTLSLPLPAAAGDLRFTATHAGKDGVLTYYQARYGRQGTRALNDLELVPTEPGGNTFQLLFKGKPVAASQVNVDTSEGWRRVLAPAQDGTVTFTPSFPGLYVLEVSARVNNGSVTLDGRKYDDVRHTATLSFEVPK